jgi:DNA polymerase III epsilon subunit-like protein
MLQRILRKWSKELGSLPRDYICYDLETTGIQFGDDLIVELGYCHVLDGRADTYNSHVIDWTRQPGIDQDWLKSKIDACTEHMRSNGRTYHMTYKRMQDDGSPPDIVFQEYKELFEYARESKTLIVGHNAVQFDNVRFEDAIREWLGDEEWTFPEHVFDTAAVVKATLTGMPPLPEETLQQYFFRVLDRPAPGVKYNLDTFCVKQFKLLDNYPDLDLADSHTAGFDAMLTHLLLE